MYSIEQLIALNRPAMVELIESGPGVRMHVKGLQSEMDRIKAQAYQRVRKALTLEDEIIPAVIQSYQFSLVLGIFN